MKNFNKFQNLSIRRKLIIFFALNNIIICLFIYFYFPSKFENLSITSTSERAITMSKMAGNYIAPAMLYYIDSLVINESIEQLTVQNPDIIFIII